MNGVSTSTVVNATTRTDSFFDKEGNITPKFKHQLDLVGLVSKAYFPAYDPYHIFNVNEHLQTKGCFQKDCEFYKNGGISIFQIDCQQAVAFLEDDYMDREDVMPREKAICDENGKYNCSAIFPCGVEAGMVKRFASLMASLKNGHNYDIVHFIVKDAAAKTEAEELINKRYQDVIEGMKFEFIIADKDKDVFQTALANLSGKPSMSDNYVIITDPTFADKVERIAAEVLPNKKCLGIASVAVKDWKTDMNSYGYVEKLGSMDKAVIAWASSAWNFKARQVNTELSSYKKTHLL